MSWIQENWFDLVQSIGIIASLLFSAYTLRLANQAQRVTNLFQLTQYHREIWTLLFTNPELHRIKEADIEAKDISSSERLFVSLLILHLSTAYEAHKVNAVVSSEGLTRDVVAFFSRPIPRRVWEELRRFQNADFVEFVESSFR